MTKSELIEKAWKSIPIHNCRVVDRAGVPFDVIDNGRLITRDDFTDILTRLLEAYDAQRGVEGWHRECAKKWIGSDGRWSEEQITSLAALIASHAPKEYPLYKIEDGKVTQVTPQGVDVEKVYLNAFNGKIGRLGKRCTNCDTHRQDSYCYECDSDRYTVEVATFTQPELAAALLAAQDGNR